MVKKSIAAIVIIMLLAGTMPVFAGGTEVTKKSVFQEVGDSISEFAKSEKSGTTEKKSLTEVFQKSSNYIKESSPRARELSLRGDKAAIAARRNAGSR